MKLTFMNALTLLLVCLKLTSHIDWSWWIILAPTWGPIAALVALELLRWVMWQRLTPAQRKQYELARAFKNYAEALTRKR